MARVPIHCITLKTQAMAWLGLLMTGLHEGKNQGAMIGAVLDLGVGENLITP